VFSPQPSTLDLRLFHRAFTLIEIMVVVAIIGLIAAMGLPSIIMAIQKDGMRKAVSDVQDICFEARKDAIMNRQTTAVVFHPQEKRLEVEGVTAASDGSGSTADASSGKVTSAVLPAGIEFATLNINLQDYGESSEARVFFYPNGTCDEMTLILLGGGQKQMITLEFSTGLASATDVTK
jgi:prepilin-type N-terminal cleavage/methylation domain-containing protein